MKQLKTPIEILSEKCGFDTISKYTYVVDKGCAIEAIESYQSQFEDKWIDVKTELPKLNINREPAILPMCCYR